VAAPHVFAVAAVDLLPGLRRRVVDDPRITERADCVEASAEVRLMHQRLILEDLPLHRQERRLEKAEIADERLLDVVAPEQPALRAAEHAPRASDEPPRFVRQEADVEETGV